MDVIADAHAGAVAAHAVKELRVVDANALHGPGRKSADHAVGDIGVVGADGPWSPRRDGDDCAVQQPRVVEVAVSDAPGHHRETCGVDAPCLVDTADELRAPRRHMEARGMEDRWVVDTNGLPVGIKAIIMHNLIPYLVMTIEENIYQQICSRIITITCTRDTTIYMGNPPQAEE